MPRVSDCGCRLRDSARERGGDLRPGRRSRRPPGPAGRSRRPPTPLASTTTTRPLARTWSGTRPVSSAASVGAALRACPRRRRRARRRRARRAAISRSRSWSGEGDPERHHRGRPGRTTVERQVAERRAAGSWRGRRRPEADAAHGLDPAPGRRASCAATATWTSSVLVGPYQCGSQTSSRISLAVRTAPGSSARSASRSNSLGVSATSLAVEPSPGGVRRSTSSGPSRCGPLGRRRRPAVARRVTARMRATSSRNPNGLTT